jgi:hypothetical protein
MKKCPKCKHKVDWIAQLKDWEKQYGKDWGSEAMVSIICDNCDSYVMGVDLYEMENGEDIYSPALKAKVKMPKIK